jgi:hypothetical protein
LSIAEDQEAKLWELRARGSLARLCRDQRRHSEARDLLAPFYGWYTEGFGTKDLKEAKALLEELETPDAPVPAARGSPYGSRRNDQHRRSIASAAHGVGFSIR